MDNVTAWGNGETDVSCASIKKNKKIIFGAETQVDMLCAHHLFFAHIVAQSISGLWKRADVENSGAAALCQHYSAGPEREIGPFPRSQGNPAILSQSVEQLSVAKEKKKKQRMALLSASIIDGKKPSEPSRTRARSSV